MNIKTLAIINNAVTNSRDTYPGNSNMLSAALGEFSELAAELTKPDNQNRILLEAADTIAVLIRIMEEGDASYGANPSCYLYSMALAKDPDEKDPFDDSEEG